MGLLRRKDPAAPATVHLRTHTTVGRWDGCHLTIPRVGVSAQHATLRWTGMGWILRDLGSRNGTLHNGVALEPSEIKVLEAGDEVTFGEADEVWVLEDASEPALILMPVNPKDPPIVVAPSEGLHPLPDAREPRATIMRKGVGPWAVELENGEMVTLRSDETVTILGTDYRISVPGGPSETAEAEHPVLRWSVDAATFVITVSPDEETAELRATVGTTSRVSQASVPLYMLAYLARARAEDKDADDAEAGWVPVELACEELSLLRHQISLQVHRVREAVRAMGLDNPASIVERKRDWMRIGVPAKRFVVHPDSADHGSGK